MFNKIILIGNLIKALNSDIRRRDSSGFIQDCCQLKNKTARRTQRRTLFTGVVVFGKQARKRVTVPLAKARSVLVEGRLQERSWEKDGQNYSRMEVVASSVRFLTKKPGAGETGESALQAADSAEDIV